MNINDLVSKYPVLEPIKSRVGDKEFYPPQADAFNTGFLNGSNLLLASPTSSGKTLVAQVAMYFNKVKKGKSVYLVPLRSLAEEKFNDFTKFYEGLLKVGISTGDLTRSDDKLGRSDLIVCSYEKFDSLLRHRASWIRDVSLVVFDEVHLMDDVTRGPLIEVLLTRLKRMQGKLNSAHGFDSHKAAPIQIIGLSATIGNHDSIGEWLNASIVKSNYRPVKLLQGSLNEDVVKFKNDSRSYNATSITELCSHALSRNKQALIFVSNRRSAESTAEKLGLELRKHYSSSDIKALSELSSHVLNALSSPTTQCRRLADCVRNGVAFNHAGLVGKQKSLIEQAFRDGLLKVISCTTVLAYGVSLPAYMVILRDLKRYGDDGMNYIPVSEYLQIAGRAGRSGYDTEGEAIVLANGSAENDKVWTEYLCAEPGELVSKLGVESVLRTHALALVCDGSCNSINSLVNFFKESFFGHEYGGDQFLRERINNVVNDLIDWGMIKEVGGSRADKSGKSLTEGEITPSLAFGAPRKLSRLEKLKSAKVKFVTGSDLLNENPEEDINSHPSLLSDGQAGSPGQPSSNFLVPSKLGERVNELYINPFSARKIVEALNNLKINPEGFIHLACSCSEVRSLNIGKSDYTGLLESLALSQDKLMLPVPEPFDYEYESFIRSFKTMLMLNEWMNEAGEDELLESFNVPPGELHSLLGNLEWVLYSIGEIAEVLGVTGVKEFINGLIIRSKYGVRSELLTLVSLSGIGRVRARKLYVNGFKTVSDLRNAGIERLSKLLGPKVAEKVLSDVQ